MKTRHQIVPCKCGCDPLLFRVGDSKQYYLLKCPACYRMVDNYDDASPTLDAAISKWNTKMRLEKFDD